MPSATPTTPRSGFFTIENDVMDSGALDNLSLCATRVYYRMRRWALRDGRCWPGLDKLATCVKFSSRSVGKAIKELMDAGLVLLLRRGGKRDGKGFSNMYQVVKSFVTQKLRQNDDLPLFAGMLPESPCEESAQKRHSPSEMRVPTTQTQLLTHTQQQHVPIAATADAHNPPSTPVRRAAAAFFTPSSSSDTTPERSQPLPPERQAAANALIEAGMGSPDAHRLAAVHDVAFVMGWIGVLPQRNPDNPGGFLRSMIEGKAQLPKVLAKKSVDSEAARQRRERIEKDLADRLAMEREELRKRVESQGFDGNWRAALKAGTARIQDNAQRIRSQRMQQLGLQREREDSGRKALAGIGGAP
jgi:hypothetical protein